MKNLQLFRFQSQANRGFTLIELLLYVAIASIMLLISSFFLQTLLQSRIKNQTIAEVDQQGLAVMQIITQIGRNAVSINSPTTSTSAGSMSFTTASSTVTVFDRLNGVIRITEGSNTPMALTNNRVTTTAFIVSNLSRTSTPGTVRIQFTISQINLVGRNEYDYTKTFIGSVSRRKP